MTARVIFQSWTIYNVTHVAVVNITLLCIKAAVSQILTIF